MLKGSSGGLTMNSPGSVRSVLVKQFGADGSVKMAGYAKQLDDWLGANAAKYIAGNAKAVQVGAGTGGLC